MRYQRGSGRGGDGVRVALRVVRCCFWEGTVGGGCMGIYVLDGTFVLTAVSQGGMIVDG